MTMSCVADAKATSSAPSPTTSGAAIGIARAEKDDRRHQQQLRGDEPAAPPPEPPRQPRHVERIDHRRPEELDRVGQARQRQQADGAEIDAAVGHPHAQRLARQRQRQPGREAEQQHDQHARAANTQPAHRGMRRRGRARSSDGRLMSLRIVGRRAAVAPASLAAGTGAFLWRSRLFRRHDARPSAVGAE